MMENDRVTFLRAENGIIVEVSHKTWDGSNITRHVFSFSDEVWDGEVLAKAIEKAFGTNRIKVIPLLNR